MLKSAEYGEIKADYDRISRVHFPKSYVPPPEMSFANNEAIFPPAALRAIVEAEFDKQCRILCFGTIPTWNQMQTLFDALRPLL